MMKTNSHKSETVAEANSEATLAAPSGSASPSDFLKLGFPSCSIFGETWHEMAAVTYLEALEAEGDKWQALSPEQVAAAMKKVANPRERGALGSILHDHDRLRAVAEKLTSAEDARNFSWTWRRDAEQCISHPSKRPHSWKIIIDNDLETRRIGDRPIKSEQKPD